MNYATRMQRMKPSAIRELLKFESDPQVISYCGGYPDPNLFPSHELNEAYQVVALKEPLAWQYETSQGDLRLRNQIAERMRRDGVKCGPENVIILQGAQQGLDLVTRLFINPGDIMLTEAPTFLGALVAFNPSEPTYVGVPIDEDGLDVDALESTLKANPGAKLLYVIPDFHNPTGVTLSLERRKRIVELANQYDLAILEDSPYRDIRYSGTPVPTIKQFDTEGRVVFVGSFSKTIAPGLRLGWAVADTKTIESLVRLKQAVDTQCSTMNMRVVSTYLERFDFDGHLENLRRIYGRKRDLMLTGLKQNLPSDVSFSNSQGGLFTWLQFPEGFDAEAFLHNHLLPEAKVAYVPGVHFYPEEGKGRSNTARLSFSCVSEPAIIEGVAKMGHLLQKYRSM